LRGLLADVSRDRDKRARAALIERYLPLARHVALRYSGGREPFEDLVQVASEALVKAVDGFDPARGFSFSTYAVPSIAGALKRYFRDHTWVARVPRPTKELVLALRKATDRLEVELGREPDDAELAVVLGAGIDQVREARAAAQAQTGLSLDATLGDDPDEHAHLLGIIAAPELDEDDIQPILRELPEREQTILSLRFRDELTQKEIAARVGMSQMHVSRLLRQSLAQLRSSLDVRDLVAA
jgi:RNA polymerase sigma-B factor